MTTNETTTEVNKPTTPQLKCLRCGTKHPVRAGVSEWVSCPKCGEEVLSRRDPPFMVARMVEDELQVMDGQYIKSAENRPNITPDEDVDYWGGCPDCHGHDGMLSPHGNHWFVCRRHLKRWCVGWNLFSYWKDLTHADHMRADLYLMAFDVAESYDSPVHDSSETPEDYYEPTECDRDNIPF